jgi:hypothetical protein
MAGDLSGAGLWLTTVGLIALGLIAVALMAGGFGFGEIGGVEVKVRGVAAMDLRTWAANSARVAGMGRPRPLGRSSPVAAVSLGGAA